MTWLLVVVALTFSGQMVAGNTLAAFESFGACRMAAAMAGHAYPDGSRRAAFCVPVEWEET